MTTIEYHWELQMPQGHAVAQLPDGYELWVLDCGGVMDWSLNRPTAGSRGFMESGRVEVPTREDRREAHENARRAAESAHQRHHAVLASFERLLAELE